MADASKGGTTVLDWNGTPVALEAKLFTEVDQFFIGWFAGSNGSWQFGGGAMWSDVAMSGLTGGIITFGGTTIPRELQAFRLGAEATLAIIGSNNLDHSQPLAPASGDDWRLLIAARGEGPFAMALRPSTEATNGARLWEAPAIEAAPIRNHANGTGFVAQIYESMNTFGVQTVVATPGLHWSHATPTEVGVANVRTIQGTHDEGFQFLHQSMFPVSSAGVLQRTGAVAGTTITQTIPYASLLGPENEQWMGFGTSDWRFEDTSAGGTLLESLTIMHVHVGDAQRLLDA